MLTASPPPTAASAATATAFVSDRPACKTTQHSTVETQRKAENFARCCALTWLTPPAPPNSAALELYPAGSAVADGARMRSGPHPIWEFPLRQMMRRMRMRMVMVTMRMAMIMVVMVVVHGDGR